MELRRDASHKENVPPRPATPLRPGKRLEQRRFLKSRGVAPGSGHGQWVDVRQAEREGPATACSPGAVRRQEPCRVQTNVAGASPDLSLVLKDATGRLMNSSLQQQSNLQTPASRPQGRARECAVQQCNLSIRGTSLAECRSRLSPRLGSELQDSFGPHPVPQGSPLSWAPLASPSSSLRRSWLLGTDTPCPAFAPLSGHTRPGSRPWCVLGSWPPRLMGEPLTLEDLTVPVQSQARAPSQTAFHQLLASVRHLEREVARLGRRAPREPPGPAPWDPWTSGGQALPTHPQPSQPVLASRGGKERPVRSLGETVGFPGARAGLTDRQASSKPASLEATLRMPTGEFLDPKQGVLLANPLRQGENFSPGPMYGSGQKRDPQLPQGAGDREARPCSSAPSRAARDVPPGQEGREVALQEQPSKEEERTASCPPDAAPARSALQNKARNVVSRESRTARCFRAWWHLVRHRWAGAAAVALGRRQLLRRGLQALRWTPRLREAQLAVAWKRHAQALLAQSFRKWRNQTLQQKQGQPHVQAGPGPPPSGAGQGQSPSGREPVADPARRSSPGSQREEAGAQPRPDGGDGEMQMLQALQHLAAFLLWCHQKEWARQERGVRGEASRAMLWTQRRGRAPQARHSPAAAAPRVASPDTQQQRARLRRCFGAWQQFVQRGAWYRDRLAHRRAGTLRLCLQQWVRMRQLWASDGAKVTQLSLCWQKAGNVALRSSVPGAATAQGLGTMARAQGLPQEQGCSSLQEACRRLALHRALLLWRTRLCQRQRADSFLQGMQQQMTRRILKGWRLRAGRPGTPSHGAGTPLAPEFPGGIPGGEALLGCSTPRSSVEKASRAPASLETLQLSFVRAAGQQQERRCLLLWQVRAQQSRRAARWHRCTLQRRVLLGWSHWATAQGAQRELAVGWAWDRGCRAALGLWRRRLAQRLEAEQWIRARARTLVRGALRRWSSCWQRQQLLQEKYQRWVQVRLQRLQRSVLREWRRAAARRRRTAGPPEQPLLLSHFQAPRGVARDTGEVFPATPVFRDGLRKAPGTAFSAWREAGAAEAWAGEQRVVRAPVAHWRNRVQGGRADGQLRRVLEAWAQATARGRVQRAAITQFRQAASRRLLWTRWAQWRAALLSGRWEPPGAQAQEACTVDRRQQPEVASRGRLLAPTDTPAPWKQTHSYRTRPSPTQHHSRSGQEESETSWAQSDREPPLCHAFQDQLRRPGRTSRAQGPPPRRPGGDCSSGASVLKGQGVASERQLGRRYLRRWHLEALPRRLQASQQARCLAATWQHWADALGEERLARTLLRQWHLKWAWHVWRRRVLRLRVVWRLQQQESSQVLSQAFEKWRQQLAARGRKRGATSSPGPPEHGGHREPCEQAGSCPSPVWGGGVGAQLQL